MNSTPCETKPKGGELARLAGMWCNEQAFLDWVSLVQPCPSPENAAVFVRTVCGVVSRAELDHDPRARARFDTFIRRPYAKYRAAAGCV